MPFRKVENGNQVIEIGKELKFSVVNISGNDIVQGNKKLILGKLLHIVQLLLHSLQYSFEPLSHY